MVLQYAILSSIYRLRWCGYAKIDPKIRFKWLSSSFSFYLFAHKKFSHLLIFNISPIPSYLRATLVLLYTITNSWFWLKWCGYPQNDTKSKINWMSSSFSQYWFAHNFFIPAAHLPIHRRDSSTGNIFKKIFNRDLPPYPTYDNFISLILLFYYFVFFSMYVW